MSEIREAGIHPTAVVSPQARIGRNVRIGAYSIIGDGVEIGDDCEIMQHATIDCNTRIGARCRIFPFASIGTAPQDITFFDEETYVEIGENNVIREFTTINRGTAKGGRYTRIGNNNYFMVYVHVAHDCHIGNNTIFTNGATLAGHVEVEDFAVIGAFSSVHQFVRIGRNAYIGGYTVVLQDILPFAKIAQKRENYCLYGPNSIGMMRNGFSRNFIENVKELFRIIYYSDLNTTQALKRIEEECESRDDAAIIVDFVRKTKRGILKNFRIPADE